MQSNTRRTGHVTASSQATEIQKVCLDQFLTMAQYPWHLTNKGLEAYHLASSGHVMCPQFRASGYSLSGLDNQLAGISADIDASQSLLPEQMEIAFDATVNAIKFAQMPFDFWADFDCRKKPDGRGYDVNECQLNASQYEKLMDDVGELFLGFEIGEWDGLYGRDVVSYWKENDYPKDRKQAHDKMLAYLRTFHEKAHSNTNALCGLTFAHYFHELPVRMVGAEIGQGLLNTQAYISSLRGACIQYGFQFKLLCSIFDRWGYKTYTDEGIVKTATGVKRIGPREGHSTGLFWAQWLMGYYAGAAIVGLEGGFYTSSTKNGLRELSPLGEQFAAFTEWSKTEAFRGKPCRPLALMMDYEAGWSPPRHLYSVHEYCVWHSIPYKLCDYAMDRIYDALNPGYCESGFYRDERGFVTPTPVGDVTDFLLTDATLDALTEYRMLWLVSDQIPSPDLRSKLRIYIENGGHVIVSGNPLVDLARIWFGIEVVSNDTPSESSIANHNSQLLREGYFSFRKADLNGEWDVELSTDCGLPLIATRNLGKGRITFITVDHGLTDKLEAPGLDSDYERSFTPDPPVELLHGVKRYIHNEVMNLTGIRMSPPGVYFSINRMAEGEGIAFMYNPTPNAWEGRIDLDVRGSIHELLGPWRATPAKIDGIVSLESNECAVFHVKGEE